MISTESKAGTLEIKLAQSLEISYLSHTNGALYKGIYTEVDIKQLHPVFGIFRNVFDNCINRNEHKIEVSDVKVIVSYTTQVHGNTIAFDLIAMCELQEGVDQNVANLQRQNRVLANRISELENETDTLNTKVDNLENKMYKLIRNFASHVWAGHGILTDPESIRPDALNKLINIRDTTIDNKNKTIYDYLTDEKKVRRGIELQGDADIHDNNGYYALHIYTRDNVNRDIVKLLVDNKADINKKGRRVYTNFNEQTPLQYRMNIILERQRNQMEHDRTHNRGASYTYYKKQVDDTEDEIKFLKSLGATE